MSHIDTAYRLGALVAQEKYAEWEKTALLPAAAGVGAMGAAGAAPGLADLKAQAEQELGRPLTEDDMKKLYEAVQSGELGGDALQQTGKSLLPGMAGGLAGAGGGAGITRSLVGGGGGKLRAALMAAGVLGGGAAGAIGGNALGKQQGIQPDASAITNTLAPPPPPAPEPGAIDKLKSMFGMGGGEQ